MGEAAAAANNDDVEPESEPESEPEQNKGGRPSKYEPERVNAIIDAISHGMYAEQAAVACGISKTTFVRWRDIYPEFKERVERAQAFAEERYIRLILRHATTSWQAAAWWLERTFPDRYGRRARVELTGAEDGPVEIAVTHEEAQAVADRFTARVVRLADARRARGDTA